MAGKREREENNYKMRKEYLNRRNEWKGIIKFQNAIIKIRDEQRECNKDKEGE